MLNQGSKKRMNLLMSSKILVIEPGFYDGHVHLCQDYFMFLYL